MLELRNVSKTVGGVDHIRDVSLTLQHGSLNVLLGPTLSGKTSLMRLMAGLDAPTVGQRLVRRQERHRRAGAEAQRRHGLPAVHQLPGDDGLREHRLAAAGWPAPTARRIDREVRHAADLLKLTPYLERTPLSLSGGQQQRTAIARAIVQERRHRAARRAARQSRLQAARGTARRAAEDLCRERHDLRLRDDRAARGAAARRQHGDPVGRAHHPVRADDRGVPQAEGSDHRAHLLRSAAQHDRAAQEGRQLPA